jgi:cytidyltransferase-like protein
VNPSAGVAVSKLGTAIVSRNELNTAIARASSADYHPGSLAVKSTAAEMAATWRRMGERVVFTNGCFDLIHAGHIELLSFAAREGDRLIVGLNSDSSVKKLKGPTRPIQTEERNFLWDNFVGSSSIFRQKRQRGVAFARVRWLVSERGRPKSSVSSNVEPEVVVCGDRIGAIELQCCLWVKQGASLAAVFGEFSPLGYFFRLVVECIGSLYICRKSYIYS